MMYTARERKEAAIWVRAERLKNEIGEYMEAVAANRSPEELNRTRNRIAARIRNLQDRECFLEQCALSNLLSLYFNDAL